MTSEDITNHPLIQGFKDKPDEEIITCAVAQLDYAAWIEQGMGDGAGMPQEVQQLIRDKMIDWDRNLKLRFLLASIQTAIKTDRAHRAKRKNA